MTINDLLALGEPVFKQIDEAVNRKDFDTAHSLLNSPQPAEWIKELPSEATEGVYYHNDIELIEAICYRLFGNWWGYEIVGQPTLTTTKTGVAITVTTRLLYSFKEEGVDSWSFGVATEFVTNAKMLQLATPKAATMSFKNSIKKIGTLFGRDLNRGIENAPIEPVVDVNPEKSELQLSIENCTDIEELGKLRKGLPSNLLPIFRNKLTELSKPVK